ncbi:MAG: hypothetical protein K2H57_09435, partial [Duncaniella sp.]|nr:hypothetical protein [Duncaniella sp.]
MKKILLTAIAMIISAAAFAQESSSSSVVRRRNADDRNAQKNSTTGVTQRMQSHFEDTPVSDSEMQWMRVMYRQLDLMKDENAALY